MLRIQLANVHCTEDLSRLFGFLEYTPDHCPLGDDAVVVGRWRNLIVVAAQNQQPAEAVIRICQTFQRSNTHVLAVGIDGHHHMVMGVPQAESHQAPRLLSLDLTNPSPDAIALLDAVRPRRARSTLQHALRIELLLASEAVSERFYLKFKSAHDGMLAALPLKMPHADRRMIVLLPLLRLLFLYFVQAKGWLAGQSDFLRTSLDEALEQRRHFHRDFLNRLFFETLNQPLVSRTSNTPFDHVPYLNGGLFERHPTERKWPNVVFANDLWRTAFDDTFERFRFCVREAYEVDAIAPDMLGRVFERIMAPQTRHTTGTFYTPESVVTRIVDTTLSLSLTHLGNLNREDASQVIAGKPINADNNVISAALEGVRVLDPAVGSGAFLLVALNSLTRAHLALRSGRQSQRLVVTLRRRILAHNLFGVDVNPIAVRLAELRLWLSVIADDPTTDIDKIEPLPNLDGFVRQGDSLFDPIGNARTSCELGRVPRTIEQEVSQRRTELFFARGKERADAISTLRQAELRMAEAALQHAIAAVTSSMRDLVAEARSKDLFGNRTGFAPDRAQLYTRHRQTRDANRRALKSVREGTVPFFSYEVHAPDIMSKGGFTTVVGNPPWVRAERLGSKNRNRLKGRFSWWRSSGNTGFRHLPDLSIAFTERALEITRPGGAVGFLLPGKVLTATYAELARQHLSREVSLDFVHRIPDREVVQFGATTYPLALVIKKETPAPNHTVRVGVDHDDRILQKSLQRAGPWILRSPNVQDALDAFAKSGTPLAQCAAASLGVKTGANKIFVGSLKHQTSRTRILVMQDGQHTFTADEVRPVVMGRDISRFYVATKHWIVWTHGDDGKPRSRLSSGATTYFRAHKRQLEARADYVGGPIWSLYRVPTVRRPYAVIWPDIVREPAAVALAETDCTEAVVLNSCYVASAPDGETALAIAAVMNSMLATAFLKLHGDEARGGYRRMNARVANHIPVPLKNRAWPSLVELSRSAHHDKSFNQHELDETVADCLGLSRGTRHTLLRVAHRDG